MLHVVEGQSQQVVGDVAASQGEVLVTPPPPLLTSQWAALRVWAHCLEKCSVDLSFSLAGETDANQKT